MFIALLRFGGSLAPDHIRSVSLNNRPCQVRPTRFNINPNGPI